LGEIAMKTIVSYVGSQDEYRFFSRLADSFLPDYRMVFLTSKPSIFLNTLITGRLCSLIRYSDNSIPVQQELRTVETLSGSKTQQQIIRLYNGVFESIERTAEKMPVSIVAIWNGSTVPTLALAEFARRNGIDTLFFELSNIPNKIFVDPQGVNAASMVYHNPAILDSMGNVSDKEYQSWKDHYVERKRSEQNSPSALNRRAVKNYLYLLDVLGVTVFGLPAIGNMNPLKRLAEKLFYWRVAATDVYNHRSRRYLFYPMQVSADSQLLLNSDVSNDDAIRYCLRRSQERGLELVIKLHPMESDEKIVRHIRQMAGDVPVYIVGTPSMELVIYAVETVTINSTVGLEAIIAEKEVTFLGRSLFPLLTGDRLKKFLLRYLIQIDYYSNDPIPAEVMRTALQRRSMH
jgi:capsular polysaccharide export protein